MVYGVMEYWSDGVMEEPTVPYLRHYYSSLVPETLTTDFSFTNTPVLHYSNTPKRKTLSQRHIALTPEVREGRVFNVRIVNQGGNR